VIRAAVLATLLSLAFGCSDPKCADGLSCKGGGGESGSASAGGSVSSGGSTSNGGNVSNGGSTSDGGNVTGGKGPTVECPPECFVAITCVKQCGGTPVSVGCCPCAAPAFDANTCKP